MSLLAKTIVGFVSLGGASVASLIWANQSKSSVPTFVAPSIKAPDPHNVVTESIKQLIKVGYMGCANIDIKGRGTPLFVCLKANNDGSYTPSFFYYGKSDTNKFLQVRQVNKTTKEFSASIEVQLDDGNTKTLSASPVWLRNITNPTLIPEKNCRVENVNGRNSLFLLKCNDKNIQQSINI